MGHYVHHYVCVCVCVGAGRVGDTEADKRLARQTDRQTGQAVGPSSRTTSSQAKVSPRPAGWSHQGAVHVFISLPLSLCQSHSLSLSLRGTYISACVFVSMGGGGVPLTCRCEFITSSNLLQVGTLPRRHLWNIKAATSVPKAAICSLLCLFPPPAHSG